MTTDWPAGQAAFVTGAASGIGLGIARALIAAGAKVAIADIDGERVDSVAKELTSAGGTVVGIQLDVSDADHWEDAADQAEKALGPISILVNNAGVTGSTLLEQTSLDIWRWIFSINTDAQFIGVSTFLPRFKKHGGRAHIMNTASMAGLIPMVGAGAYSASKAASVAYSRVLKDELALGGEDIGVSVLCPGSVATRIALTAAEGEAKVLGTEVNTAAAEANTAMAAKGADPDKVGEQVLEAIRQRQFLILTHRDWQPLTDGWQDEIKQAYEQLDDRYGPDVAAQFLVSGQVAVSTENSNSRA
ncbi:MAG: SDR family oxidoreductase [Nocardia sp.]|nr:SDR family oxidoreductase [Nocardia sp.]